MDKVDYRFSYESFYRLYDKVETLETKSKYMRRRNPKPVQRIPLGTGNFGNDDGEKPVGPDNEQI